MLRPTALIVCTCAFAQAPYATSIAPATGSFDIPANRGSAALWQSLKKLHTRASLLMITAHPDDEDGGMLTYESRGQGTRVALLTLNRGEGGANVMSPEFFDALGLVRTMELLAAGRYYGAEQYWTRVVDYGFSKTRAESTARWTHDRVLGDVVRMVRAVRPLVVTSVFAGTPTDGHGNHETAGALAREVIEAAADPARFPEQVRAGLLPWQAAKQYARTPWFGQSENRYTVDVEVPEGTYDPVLGATYAQVARQGLGFQKTQNGGPAIPKTGPVTTAYHRFWPARPGAGREQSFFDGIDVSVAGIATLAGPNAPEFLVVGLRDINRAVEQATAAFDAPHPERTAPFLAVGLKATVALISAVNRSDLDTRVRYDIRHELEIKRVQFNNALAQALGLSIAATVTPTQEPPPRRAAFLGDPETFRLAIPGQSFGVRVHVVGQSPLMLDGIRFETAGAWNIEPASSMAARPLTANTPIDVRFTVQVPANAPFTRPYFSRPDIEQSYYDISDERWLGRSVAPYPLSAWAEFTYQGAPVRIGQVVETMKRVTGLGAVYEPLAVAPAISVAIEPRAGVVPLTASSFPVAALIHSNVKGPAKGSVRLELPAGWRSEPPAAEFNTAADGQEQTVRFTVVAPRLSTKPYLVTALAEYAGKSYREGYTVTGYPGLRPYYLYRPAEYRTTGVDVKVAPGLRVAYISGSGDEVPASLANLGITPVFLSSADIASADLSKFDAIVLGVRAYAVRSELIANNARLLAYVNGGGVVIVQYNTPEYDHNYGPYPYKMGDNPEEVTDEASRVDILKPSHPLFAWPNRITGADFTGWVEERGSKWMQTWDPRYEALLEAHDAGQAPQKGGLLYAKYGKGVYIYNAWAFYRQLPEGVPGAYRIFANLLSIGKNPQR